MDKVRSADGTAIAYEATGAGAPVVLVDGAFGNRGFPSAVADLLGETFTAVRYDRRGRNDSGDAGLRHRPGDRGPGRGAGGLARLSPGGVSSVRAVGRRPRPGPPS